MSLLYLPIYRYRSAQKQATSGGNVTKVDGIKEEMEEAQLKVDIARDSLAADIYTLLAKESEFAKVTLILYTVKGYNLT